MTENVTATFHNHVGGFFSIKSQGVEFVIPDAVQTSGRIFVSTTNGYRRLRTTEADFLKKHLATWLHVYSNHSYCIRRNIIKMNSVLNKLQNFETMYL